MPGPTAVLSPLNRADGSVTYSYNGYTIIGSVNGPIEVQRRDEIPEEAALEVNLRPAAGVGGVKERYLESEILSTIRRAIQVRQFPRTLIQLTLQIESLPENEGFGTRTTSSSLPLLPHLLQTSLLALLSASIPLLTTFTSVLVAALPSGIRPNPSPKEIKEATSLHVFSFSLQNEVFFAVSEGYFSIKEWHDCSKIASGICTNVADGMEPEGQVNLEQWVREVVKVKVEEEQRWRGAA